MDKSMRRYRIFSMNDKNFLLSNSSSKIVDVLRKNENMTYESINLLTGVEISSIYVFAQRLEKFGIIKRRKILGGSPRKLRTILSINKGLHELPVEIVR